MKRLLYILLVLCLSQIIIGQQTSYMMDGLILLVHFNKGSGTTVLDEIKQRKGAITGAVAWVTGKHENAVEFPGDINAYIDFTDEASWKIQTFTWGMWFKFTGFPGGTRRIVNTTIDAPVGFILTGNSLYFSTQVDGFPQGASLPYTFFTLEKWYHVVGTRSGSLTKLYINGNLENTYTKAGSVAYSGHPLRFGDFPQATGQRGQGAIDEFFINKRALSKGEIKQLYIQDKGNYVH